MPHRLTIVLIIWAFVVTELQTANSSKIKFLVSVQHLVKSHRSLRHHVCSGVLLTRRVVLTGCSCVTTIHQDPKSMVKTTTLMDIDDIVVYVGSVMDTTTMKRTEKGEALTVESIFIHPQCDVYFTVNFAIIITQKFFTIKGLLLVKTLHKAEVIKEFIIGTLNLPRACSTLSWMTDNSTAPCVRKYFKPKYNFAIEDVADEILEKRSAEDGNYRVVLRSGPSYEYFAKTRIDVDFVDKRYCMGLVSVCALNPHGCISGVHGLKCGEWCLRSLDCKERLCKVDTGSPVFCNQILVGIVSNHRVIANCEGSHQILTVVSGFDSALLFIKHSLSAYKTWTTRQRSLSRSTCYTPCPLILTLTIIIFGI